MSILEVRDGFVKFETKEKVTLSAFIKISDIEANYIAQIVQIKRAGNSVICYAKLLYTFDGKLSKYNGQLPSKESVITEFSFNEINKEIEITEPIVVGTVDKNETPVIIDKSCFDNKLLLSFEHLENSKNLLNNLTETFSEKNGSILIDMVGLNYNNAYIAGKDFKLPLNTEALSFIYEDCLDDATMASKDTVKEIFQELSEYSKTVNFMPFATLKTIVDEMVNKSHIFKLLVLKNKLDKFAKLGYFASNKSEAENLNNILSKKNVTIDVSKLDATFQNRYISLIYSNLEKKEIKPQIFVILSNKINKKVLKTVLCDKNTNSTVIAQSGFKYINEIKSIFENFIIEPSFVNKQIFKVYTMFLSSMSDDTYLLVGKGTNYIPLVTYANFPKIKVSKQENTEETVRENPDEDILKSDVSEIDNAKNIENNSPISAIDKKSEDLIEQIAGEIVENKVSDVKDIFNSNEEDNLENLDEYENLTLSIDETEEFHTEVDSTRVYEVSENIQEEENSEAETTDTIENIDSELTANADDLQEISEENEIVTEIPDEPEDVSIEPAIDMAEMQEIDDSSEIMTEISDKTDDLVNEPAIDMEETSELSFDTNNETEIIDESIEPNDIIQLDSNSSEDVLIADDFIANDINIDNVVLETIDVENEVVNDTVEEIFQEADTNENSEFEEIAELDNGEITDNENTILIDLADEDTDEISEQIDQEIVEDVDRVFTTIKEDDISESDLDLIDELNQDSDLESNLVDIDSEPLDEIPIESNDDDILYTTTLEEIGNEPQNEKTDILETKSASTPIVPVYEADIPQEDIVESDNIEQGDTIIHSKYGNGVVEKMIKYGNKTLYSINFDNVGRRLLDPTLTEIKKA